MFYEPAEDNHGLPYDPFKSCVVPRPIGWISTRAADGQDNLAPYSQFTNIGFDPPIVMFSANQKTTGERKDSVNNAEQTGVFGWNLAIWDLREAVNMSAQEIASNEDEFVRAGLEKVQAQRIDVPLVAASPVRFECRYLHTVRIPGNGTMGTVDVVFGQVIGVHIADDFITEDGKIDVLKARPIARMGYYDYTSVESRFEMIIPDSDHLLAGLEGSSSKAHGPK